METCIAAYVGPGVAADELPLPDTAVWSDYDGDTIYGDYTAEWVEVQPDVWELEVEDRTAYLPGIGQMDNATGEVMYTHGDQVGSLRAVTRCTVGAGNCVPGETASVLQRPVYTAFGELVYDLAPLDTFIRYRYAGDWGYEGRLGSETNGGSDSALGLPYTHVGHRWYDPSTGRFLQRDPIGIRGGLNVYSYAGENPVLLIDPHGLNLIDASAFGDPPSLFTDTQQYGDDDDDLACDDLICGTMGHSDDDYSVGPVRNPCACAAAAGGHRKVKSKFRRGVHTRAMSHPSQKTHKAKLKALEKGTWKKPFNFFPIFIECPECGGLLVPGGMHEPWCTMPT